MTKTFTQSLELNDETKQEKFPILQEPSFGTLQNILNYSRNLEIKPSQHVAQIEYIKS